MRVENSIPLVIRYQRDGVPYAKSRTRVEKTKYQNGITDTCPRMKPDVPSTELYLRKIRPTVGRCHCCILDTYQKLKSDIVLTATVRRYVTIRLAHHFFNLAHRVTWSVTCRVLTRTETNN